MKPSERFKVSTLLKEKTEEFQKEVTDDVIDEIAKTYNWSNTESKRVVTKIWKMYNL